jgi:hypothetical protein
LRFAFIAPICQLLSLRHSAKSLEIGLTAEQ